MRTWRDLYEALRNFAESEAPSLLDTPIIATDGNDDSGIATVIEVETFQPAGNLDTNGIVGQYAGEHEIECPDLVLVLPEMPNALEGFAVCERGNTLLTDGDGGFIAWLDLGGARLQVSYQPNNYPSLNVQWAVLSDEQLAAHINAKCQGWFVQKCNTPGVNMNDEGYIGETPDSEDTCEVCHHSELEVGPLSSNERHQSICDQCAEEERQDTAE